MLNIVVPLAGKSKFFKETEYHYPKPLIEISGRSMIERVIENLQKIEDEKQFIFILEEDDCRSCHLDAVIQLLIPDVKIVRLPGNTQGAACSVLMAIEHINNDDELVICNGDQIFNCCLNEALGSFRKRKLAGGVITFNSVHPRWSFVRMQEDKIIELTEKRPVSNIAVAGFYYFQKGTLFVESAKESIKKDASVDGQFYIAPTINQLVLKGLPLGVHAIDVKSYHTLYSPSRIKEYENHLKGEIIHECC